MNVWYTFSTIFNRRRVLQLAGLLTLCVAFITMLFLGISANAAPGVNQTISFQGRLLTPQGQPVADGYYNIQFKIYQDGSGEEAGNPNGTLEWTETRINNGGNNGVFVKNGYMSVDLGSQTPFGNSVDWNQDTLWLSMNIAGSSTLCSTFGGANCIADGEMLPMKRLTSTPYALNAGKLGGISSDGFIHNGTGQQTGDFNLSGTGIANTLQGTSSVLSPNLDRATVGTLSIGETNASTIAMGTGAGNQTINIGRSAEGAKTIAIGNTSLGSETNIQGGSLGVRIESAGGTVFRNTGEAIDTLALHPNGDVDINLSSSSDFAVNSTSGNNILNINDSGVVSFSYNSGLQVNGTAQFEQGVNIQGTTTYMTPGGFGMTTAINIPNYAVGAYSSIFAFGLPATSSDTARGMLVADARTGNHQASIGVLSTDESNILGFSYNGSNTKGYVSNTGNSIALQGNSMDILTATNAGGKATVGIGNNAGSGFALDVTGEINTSDEYLLNGVSVLNNTGLNFTGASEASVNAASGQALRLTGEGGVKIGDSAATGDPTLLTLDKGATTPGATGDAVLGSMYYDTTLGKVQCYEADGWGSCSSSPDNFITLSPEYSNAVTSENASGTFAAGFCSDALNLNDGSDGPEVCGLNETYNYYGWTSTGDQEMKDIFVTYQLPGNFTGFVEGSTSLLAKSNDIMAGTTYQVYKNTSSGLVACGSALSSSPGFNEWQKLIATGSADPANCGFTASDSLVIKISLESSLSLSGDAYAYASNLSFAFSNE